MAFSGLGAGTGGDPYQITTWAQFKEIADYLSASFLVMNDIDANFVRFNTGVVTFTGVLDGDDHVISNILDLGYGTCTLFLCNNSTVKNITLFSNSSNYNCIFANQTHTAGDNCVFSDITINTNAAACVFVNQLTNSTITNLTINNSATITLTYYNCTGNTITNLIMSATDDVVPPTGSSNDFIDCVFTSVGTANYLYCGPISNNTYTSCIFYINNSLDVRKYDLFESSAGSVASTFTKCTFFVEYTLTLITTPLFVFAVQFAYVNGTFDRCYFTGHVHINIGTYTGTYCTVYQSLPTNYLNFIDCHIDTEVHLTLTTPYTGTYFNLFYGNNNTRTFYNQLITGFESGTAPGNGTNIFINETRLGSSVVFTGNYTRLSDAQCKVTGNFTNFDFVNTWEVDSNGYPKLRNVAYEVTESMLPPVIISSISVARLNSTTETLTINTIRSVPNTGTIICYISTTLEGLEDPANIVASSEITTILRQASLTLGEGTYYVLVKYTTGLYVQTFSTSSYHYTAEQVETTVLNILEPNWTQLSDPRHSLNHGLLYHDDYIYGTARGVWDGITSGTSIFRLQCTDYTQKLTNKFYLNKTNQVTPIAVCEQVVYCSGFVWTQSTKYLIRINLNDLDYMIFDIMDAATAGQPISTNGTYLFVCNDNAIYKIDVSLLIGSFASYGYTGTSAVSPPNGATLEGCSIIQYHPTRKVYPHSIIAESDYIYIAVTTSSIFNGLYDGITMFHFQKVDITTMTTAGDVKIPKTTDDMTLAGDYIILMPEYMDSLNNEELLMYDAGVIAIKKSTLEIKYLRALHKDFNTDHLSDRAGYGVQYFGTYTAIQMMKSKKLIVVDMIDIDNWSPEKYIGYATRKIYTFQFNGVDAVATSNELVPDNNGWFHANTWENNTIVYKFGDTYISLEDIPIIQTILIEELLTHTILGGVIIQEGSLPITEVGFYWGTTIDNLSTKITLGEVTTSFQSTVTFTPGIYYFKAYAISNSIEYYGATISFTVANVFILENNTTVASIAFRPNNSGFAVRCCKPAPGIVDGVIGSTVDYDNNSYTTIVINEIEWTVENLKTLHYNNGDLIPELIDDTDWANTILGALIQLNKPM